MPTPAPPVLRLPSRRALTRWLVACMVVFVLLHVLVLVARYEFHRPYVFGLAHRFDMDQEGNVPTLFTVLVLLGASLMAALHAAIERTRRGPHVRAWALFALGLAWLGFDDGAEIHELVSRYLRPLVSEAEPVGMAIVAAGAALLLVVAWRARPFLASLPAGFRRALVVAGALYLVGAVGLEIVGWEIWRFHGFESLAFAVVATLEEVLEMTAAILFLVSLRGHLAAREKELTLAL